MKIVFNCKNIPNITIVLYFWANGHFLHFRGSQKWKSS